MTTSGRMAKGLMVTFIAAAFGIGFAWLAGKDGIAAFGYPVFVICAALALAVNWIAFVPAAIARTEKYYDLMGSFTFLSIIALACFLSGPLDVRAMVAAAMVTVWTSRLGLFLFRRIGAVGGVDGRFDAIKTNPPRFLVTWTLQAMWAIVTASAAIVIISARDRVPLDPFFWGGAAVWAIAFTIEVVADWQKAAFRADPANRGRFITTGLWSWSQHPNYFGEIMMWVGMAIMAVPLLSGWSFIVFMSPLLIFLLLTRVSGINLLDAAGEAKWGDEPQYRAYRARTSVLVPRPAKRG
jgi:steroid 5-alpha reductase family enzyme